MKDIYLVNYSVSGIKSLDQQVSLSFYKKTISQNPDTREYNIKGIYGMNGSGKSGIVTSVDVLRNLLVNPGYLSNPIVQKNLDATINKKTGRLSIEADYLADGTGRLFRYAVTLAKDDTGKYVITQEELLSRRAVSKNDAMGTVFRVSGGEIKVLSHKGSDEFSHMLLTKTVNLLGMASMSALFYEKILIPMLNGRKACSNPLMGCLSALFLLGKKLHVYLEQSDDHTDFLLTDSPEYREIWERDGLETDALVKYVVERNSDLLNTVKVSENIVAKARYGVFAKTVARLYEFLHIFKSELRGIEIDKKEDHNVFFCSLIMVYDSYKIHAEFESTVFKKLIKLFAYLSEMVQGGIVFIDEFDSNLHDVYLCALLEYLMEYGEGQLCFTTHNVGPMDVLKQHKKSIDFLSEDHRIYPWTTSGNYSPSKLYRNGMIEGSPFNVDSVDFIGVFAADREDV